MSKYIDNQILNQTSPRVRFDEVTVTSRDGLILAPLWTRSVITRLIDEGRLTLITGDDDEYLQNPNQPNLPGFE